MKPFEPQKISSASQWRESTFCSISRHGPPWCVMSSLRNAVKRVEHKERAQPASRRKLGLLEKHKDYGMWPSPCEKVPSVPFIQVDPSPARERVGLCLDGRNRPVKTGYALEGWWCRRLWCLHAFGFRIMGPDVFAMYQGS